MAGKKKTLDSERAAYLGHIGGNTTTARYGGYAMTARLRDGLEASWLRKADPDGVLSESERRQRADALKRAHYARITLASIQARQARSQMKKAS
jgi:hypothetical protein